MQHTPGVGNAHRSRFARPGISADGRLIGGTTSLLAAVYSQRVQYRVQRVSNEVAKRETVYADFVMNASNMLLSAFISDEISLGGDEQQLIGLINRMRLFAPSDVVDGAEAVLRVIVEIALKPSVELRQLASDALSKSLDPDPLVAFSEICRSDLDHARRAGVRRTLPMTASPLPARPSASWSRTLHPTH